jgi:hypothetical protein
MIPFMPHSHPCHGKDRNYALQLGVLPDEMMECKQMRGMEAKWKEGVCLAHPKKAPSSIYTYLIL